jgi:hypothetical protein
MLGSNHGKEIDSSPAIAPPSVENPEFYAAVQQFKSATFNATARDHDQPRFTVSYGRVPKRLIADGKRQLWAGPAGVLDYT